MISFVLIDELLTSLKKYKYYIYRYLHAKEVVAHSS